MKVGERYILKNPTRVGLDELEPGTVLVVTSPGMFGHASVQVEGLNQALRMGVTNADVMRGDLVRE